MGLEDSRAGPVVVVAHVVSQVLGLGPVNVCRLGGQPGEE